MNNTLYSYAAITTSTTSPTFPIKKVGKGELLGWEDILVGRSHTSSVRCASLTGTLFKIDAKTFQKGTAKDQDIKVTLQRLLLERDNRIIKKIN